MIFSRAIITFLSMNEKQNKKYFLFNDLNFYKIVKYIK